jgi:hypothetical protein
MTISALPCPSLISAASVDSATMIDTAQETGTVKVIQSPQRALLTPLVSFLGVL